jgi:L-alanine-DL-glutamate epimerase-like enolase superfamily enzyme
MSGPRIEGLEIAAYTVPTDAPESDGTLTWDATTMVCVHASGGGERGFGYTYNHAAAAAVIRDTLAPLIRGRSAMDIPGAWQAMAAALRNVGRPGIGASAISAVDVALWDLKARLLGVPLASLLGQARDAVPVYGSGGFTSYDEERLRAQLGGWVADGIGSVKMKVGREPALDAERVAAAREAIGPRTALMVDANGAYDRQQALGMARRFAEQGVSWFEEPVSSDDLAGLRVVRDGAPPGMEITAGEYGYDAWYFRRMLDAGAVDVLQADATRCGGITGFLAAARECEARSLPLSSHTAPALHLAVCCAAPAVRHIEYFHDHVRIESMLLDGVPAPHRGCLAPDLTRAGIGFNLDERAARPYRTGDDR